MKRLAAVAALVLAGCATQPDLPAGMTPMQVLVAATRNSAEFLRLADSGTIAAGKSADFIVLDANLLDDITHTRRIASVVLRGTAIDRSQPSQ